MVTVPVEVGRFQRFSKWWFDSLFSSSCETPQSNFVTVFFYKAWPTNPIGSSQEPRLHATIAILGSVSSAQLLLVSCTLNFLRERLRGMYDFIWSQVRSRKKMLRRIKSVLEVTWRRCLGSYLKTMLRRIKSVLEVTWRSCYCTKYQERLGTYLKKLLRRIKSVLEVTWRRCYDVSRASWKLDEDSWRRCYDVSRVSWKLLEEDVTTYQERLGS